MPSSHHNSDDDGQPSSKKAKLNEDYDEDSGTIEEIFYNLSPDCTFQFLDGKVIKCNKELLYNATRSRPMYQILFGPLKDEETVIKDIDSDCFKLFLDCVMEFKPMTRQNALKIFSILWKYQIDKWIGKCLEILEPQEMDKEVCLTLNLALSYNCDVLKDQTLNFILSKVSPYELLENKTFMFLLEPDSLHEIIRGLSLDSVIIKALVDWGLNYLKNINRKLKSVRYLFKNFEIMNRIQFEDFGTTNELFKFVTADLTKNFYSKEEIAVGMESDGLHHRKSEWKYIKEGDELIEEIPTQFWCNRFPMLVSYKIEFNRAVCYVIPKSQEPYFHFAGELVINEEKCTPFQVLKYVINSPRQLESTLFCRFQLNAISSINDERRSTLQLKLKLRFPYDCRILMMTKPENSVLTNDKMYFTKRVSLIAVQ